jgi:hypothetical protein
LCLLYPHDIIDKIRLLEAVMQQVAQGLASLGRGNDKMLVHMTPREVHGLQALAMAHGGSLTINPKTGLPEAGFLDKLLPIAAGFALGPAGFGLVESGLGAAALVGGLGAVSSGSLQKGLMAGLGAYGGFGLGQGLANMGLNEVQSSEVAKLIGPEAVASPQAMSNALRFNPLQGYETIGGVDTLTGPVDVQLGTTEFSAPKVTELARTSEAALANTPPQQAAARGLGQFVSDPVAAAKNLYGQVGLGGVTTIASPFIPDMLKQNTLAPNAAAQNKGNIRPYQYTVGQVDPEAQRQVSQFGFSKVPYFTGQGYTAQPIYAAAAGGQVPSPSLPLDLSQNYPGSNISKSSYATLPATNSQEVVDGYGPKINPFTGAEGMAAGGIASLPEYAAGGKLLRGPGDGMSDDIPAVIKGETPQRAALADGEFVIPADVVSHLGNGSTDAGAKRLYTMMDRVRKARTGNPKQGKQINAERLMPA